jgi:ferredoxin, 2Fe-2S
MKVKFMPMNVEHEIEFNETVLHLAQRHDIHIQSVCKGIPSCAECRIQLKQGEHNVPHPSTKELSLIGTAYYIDQSRLSCQLRCFGDVVVDLSEQLEKENRAAKRPQGRANRADGEKSHAVKGILIEEYKENEQLVAQIDPQEERPGHDKFYNEFSQDFKGLEGKPRRKNRPSGKRR